MQTFHEHDTSHKIMQIDEKLFKYCKIIPFTSNTLIKMYKYFKNTTESTQKKTAHSETHFWKQVSYFVNSLFAFGG